MNPAWFGFCALCFCYGTSYAVMSYYTNTMKVDTSTFAFIRMSSACCFAYFKAKSDWSKLSHNDKIDPENLKRYSSKLMVLSSTAGVVFLGMPVTFISFSCRSVPSFIVNLMSSTIPLFSMIVAHFMLSDEPLIFSKFMLQIFSLFGAALTILPTISDSNSAFNPIDWLLLLLAVILFGAGGVFIRKYLYNAELGYSVTFSLLGSTVYTTISATISIGLLKLISNLFDLLSTPLLFIQIVAYGFVYSCIPTFLFMYVCCELGAVTTSLTDFGQIIIGTIVGVVFLNEWNNYRREDIIVCILGLIIIALGLAGSFAYDAKFRFNFYRVFAHVILMFLIVCYLIIPDELISFEVSLRL